MSQTMQGSYTVPGLAPDTAARVADLLQQRLTALLDLQLTLKHIHWNVIGPTFISVHQMLDPQVDAVREMSDELAERIATLGHEPQGTPGAVVARRSWDDYSLGRAGTQQHLGALDVVYSGVVNDHRQAVDELGTLDLVSQGMVIEQSEKLELYQWFVRAHLENSEGRLQHDPGDGERAAAAAQQGQSVSRR